MGLSNEFKSNGLGVVGLGPKSLLRLGYLSWLRLRRDESLAKGLLAPFFDLLIC